MKVSEKGCRKVSGRRKGPEILYFQGKTRSRPAQRHARPQRAAKRRRRATTAGEVSELQTRQNDAALRLVLAFLVVVADFAVFVGLKKDDLAKAFVGVNLRGQRRGVADFECDVAFPLRLERRDVDDDAASSVSGFADANRQHVARNPEI